MLNLALHDPDAVIRVLKAGGLPVDDLCRELEWRKGASLSDMMTGRAFPLRNYAELGFANPGELATAITAGRFRQLVDEWIDTGRSPSGSEFPPDRDLFRAPMALAATANRIKNTPVALTLSRTGGNHYSIDCRAGELPAGVVSWRLPPDRRERALNEGEELFARLIQGDWFARLCKCRYPPCGVYFMLRETQARNPLKNGSFCCRGHQSHDSAAIRTKTQRETGKQKLIEAAALKLVESPGKYVGWQTQAKPRRALAGALCHEIARQRLDGYRNEVEANWVARHRTEIEAKVSLFGT